MSLNKYAVLALILPLSAFSFAAGGLMNWLAGGTGGRALYQIGKQSFTEKAALDELRATISLHPGIKQSDIETVQNNSNFRHAFLRSRYTGDVLAALADKDGLLDTPEALAWMRIAVREAVKQFCMLRMTAGVTVSSNEIVAYYDAHAAALAHLSLTDALTWAEEKLLQEKRTEALVKIVLEAEETLSARTLVDNW